MKKLFQNLILAAILVATSFTLQAQTEWLTAGNGLAPNNNTYKLGTTNGYDLKMITNNQVKMTLKVNGNAGIGTTSPVNKLEVVVTKPEDGIRVTQNGGSSGNGAAALHLKNNTSGGKMWSLYSLGSGNSIQGSGNFMIEEADDYGVNFIDRFIIMKGTGNVGIGTIAPGAKLEVAGGDARINGVTVGLGGGSLATNTSLGFQALVSNTSGFDNVANGYLALYSNSGGYFNTATGYTALYYNSNGICNSAFGAGALFSATAGNYNTAVGNLALYSNDGGNYLTGLGCNADVAGANLSNSTVIGFGALVNQSDKIRLGNAAVTVIEGNVVYTVSDGRFKTNITEEVKGLDFINKLRPVQYNFEARKFDEFLSKNSSKETRELLSKLDYTNAEKARYDGFIAQEVEAAAREINYAFNGVHLPVDENDNYSLAYSEFVVPLVKSVQELSKQNDELKSQLAVMQAQINALMQDTKLTVDVKSKASSFSTPILDQIAPNPFSQRATIRFSLPANATDAQLLISDLSGKVLKSYTISSSSTQQVINGNEFSAGTYQYSISISGKIIDSRQMVVVK